MTVTLLRGTRGHDEYGDAIDDDEPEEIVLPHAVVGPVVEPAIDDRGRDGIIIRFNLYDLTSQVQSDDLVQYGDAIYRIDGEPAEFISPFTGRTLRQAALIRTEG